MNNNTCLPPNLIYKLLQYYNIDPVPLFQDQGIDLNLLNQESQRIDCKKIKEVWRQAELLIDEPCFALKAGDFWHPSFMNALGYAWLASGSLYTALFRLQRFSKIISHSFNIDLIESEQELIIQLGDELLGQRRPIIEAILSILLAMCRVNYGIQLYPLRVTLAYQEPIASDYYQKFFQSDVLFQEKSHSMVFSMDVVKQPLASGNPNFIAFHEQEMLKYLSQMNDSNLLDRLRQLIVEQLPSGRVTITSVANSLALSSRQLQRKLGGQQISFKQLLDEIRLSLSYQYLKNPRLSLIEIAFLLGFSEVSSFSRAFKRAKGISPNAYRQQIHRV